MSIIKDAWDVIKEKTEWKETQQLARKIPDLERRIAELEHRLSGNPSGQACDECGSLNIKRTGSRPNKTFGDLGVKDALYTCSDCGGETSIMINPPK